MHDKQLAVEPQMTQMNADSQSIPPRRKGPPQGTAARDRRKGTGKNGT
jgi:hypothetical protein